jgi:hypothetical protein
MANSIPLIRTKEKDTGVRTITLSIIELKIVSSNSLSGLLLALMISRTSGCGGVIFRQHLIKFLGKSNKTCNDMLKQATIDAKQRAKILAEALDTQIIKVKSVNPYCSLNSRSSRPVYMNAKADYMSSAETTNTVMETIEPGTINVSVSVNLVYYLK